MYWQYCISCMWQVMENFFILIMMFILSLGGCVQIYWSTVSNEKIF